MTYRDLKTKLEALDDRQLDSSVKWVGVDGSVLEFYFEADDLLIILPEHYVKAYGDGLQPISAFVDPDEDPLNFEIFHIGKKADLTVVLPANTVLLTVNK